jgi:hypothetical protein
MRTFHHDSMTNQDKGLKKSKRRAGHQSMDATFLAWQQIPTGGAIALYNITDRKHPSYGSTVTGNTLRNLNLQVPPTPPKPPLFPPLKFPNK